MSIIAKHLCHVEFLADCTSEEIGIQWRNIALAEKAKGNMIVAYTIPIGSGMIESIERFIQKELKEKLKGK